MGFWKDIYDIIMDILERIGIIKPPKREVPPIIKQEIHVYGDIIKNEFKDVTLINPKWNEDFIIITQKEPQIKDKKLKINSNSPEREKLSFIDASKAVYPSLSRLLPNEAKVGLQLYVNYRVSLKNKNQEFIDYINKGINNLNQRYKDIKYWFEIFVKLDLTGNLEGIVVPLSKSIDINKDDFINLIKNIVENKKRIQPQEINGNKLAIIKMGKEGKVISDYFSFSHRMIEKGCNKLIIVGFGKWRYKVMQLSNILEPLYKMEKLIIVTKIFNSINDLKEDKESTKGYFIHLTKVNNKILKS